MNATRKRKLGSGSENVAGKRLKLTTASGSTAVTVAPVDTSETNTIQPLTEVSDVQNPGDAQQQRVDTADSVGPKRPRINKLVPPRPFPTVPTSVSATGPRSAHKEGKNFICLTRKTPLGSYMRRCKDVILKDGYVWCVLARLSSYPCTDTRPYT